MANTKELAYLVLFFSALLIGCDSVSLNDNDDNYPYLIERLSTSELQALNNEYHSKNNDLICSTLNEYGYTGFSRVLFPNNINPCLDRTEIKQELVYTNDLLEVVKQKLIANSDFTGVVNPDMLATNDIISLDGCTICEGDINNIPLQWKFTFEPQQENGIEVLNTEIIVYVDANGVNRIWGNWFEVVDPGFIEFGSNNTMEKVIGLKLIYANEMNQLFKQIILEEHILGEPSLKYVGIEVDSGLEIHKAWVLNILQENTNDIRWKAFISTVSGEILDIQVQ